MGGSYFWRTEVSVICIKSADDNGDEDDRFDNELPFIRSHDAYYIPQMPVLRRFIFSPISDILKQPMMGYFTSLLTFPGVALHEFAHKKFCDWFGVRVFKVRYFRFGNPVGYVEHAEPEKYRQVFWISFGPLIINTIVAIVVSMIAFTPNTDPLLASFLLWIAFSAGANAFPSGHDMHNVITASKNPLSFKDFLTLGFLFRYLSLVFVFPMKWIGNARYLWFFYAFALIAVGFWL